MSVLAGTLVLAACAGGDDDDASSDAAEPARTVVGPVGDAGDSGDAGDGGDDSGDAGFVETGGAAVESDFDIGVVGRDVIIEMHVVLSSDDVERTVAAIMADAARLGGGVASSDVEYGTDRDEHAVLTVKVPPQSIDRLLAGLDDTATVRSINQSAQDVTEQLVDLDVRISNARRSVANVREFMDRAEDLDELVTLEGELTRRQTELERLEAQQRGLSDRVALSTVTIEVVPTTDVPEPRADDGIADAFRQGWDAFAAFFFGLAFVLAVLLPFLALGATVLGVAWLIVTRLGRDRDHRPDAPVDDADGGLSDEAVTAGHETVSASHGD